jgi:alcohol dehydrogenase class IV
LGYLGQVKEYLTVNEIAIQSFSQIEPEPSIETVQLAHQAIVEFAPDIVIALGGGSVMDVAKVSWLMYEQPGIKIEEISIFTSYDTGKSRLVTIPTTSGSGADMTPGVVLTDRQQGRKIVLYAREFQPSLTIVDPSLVMRVPAQVTADTGMDVISHAVEAFASPWHNDFSDGLAVKALQLTFVYLPLAFVDGSDEKAREHMHNAATISGLAMANSSVSLGHALAHAFGGIFPIPHGRLVGMFLPYSMEFTANSGDSRYQKLAKFLGIPSESEQEGLKELVNEIRELAQKIDQPLTISEMGIEAAELERVMPELVEMAASDHQMLTTLRVPDERELAKLYRYAYSGKSVDF